MNGVIGGTARRGTEFDDIAKEERDDIEDGIVDIDEIERGIVEEGIMGS